MLEKIKKQNGANLYVKFDSPKEYFEILLLLSFFPLTNDTLLAVVYLLSSAAV